MAPSYLQSQIDQSLVNLGISTIDVYYIHNPESQLGSVSRAEFEARLRSAFELLERNITEGRIKMYGVATWSGFRVPSDDPGHLSLERLVQMASRSEEHTSELQSRLH